MAINNIIYLVKNYRLCSECDNIVLSWVMSENTINKIASALEDTDLKIFKITLICSAAALIDRWKNDKITEWRNDDELNNSLQSLDNYRNRTDSIFIDTNDISVDNVVNMIINKLHI